MKYEIKRLNGKPRQITASGSLTFTSDGFAYAMSETSIIANLDRAKLDLMNSDGLILSGFEECGTNRNGTVKYKYSEWFCRYLP